MKYVDASAILRILFAEPGPTVPLDEGDRVVSSQLVDVEVARPVDRERLLGKLSDAETATKRQELDANGIDWPRWRRTSTTGIIKSIDLYK